MNITIKVLKGEEFSFVVTPETTIIELKKRVEQKLKIPVVQQKILFLGRPLLDENKISSYPNLRDGTKLTLVTKKPDCLKDMIFKHFRKYYNEYQSEKLTSEFMLDFERRLKQLSLDDIERLATNIISQGSE